MNEQPNDLNPRAGATRTSLAERLDPALGEASAGIGVILTELLRRTLRGGVGKVEDEIDSLVGEKLEFQVARRMPAFELAATEKAAERARMIANELVEAAQQSAEKAVEQLRQETQDSTTKLATQSQTLANQSAELANRSTHLAESIEATRTQAEQAIESSARAISDTIVQTESRMETKTRELLNNHVMELAKKSQKTYQLVQEKLENLSSQDEILQRTLADERAARLQDLAEQQRAWSEQRTLFEQLGQRIVALQQAWATEQAKLRGEIEEALHTESKRWSTDLAQGQAELRAEWQAESAKWAAAIQNQTELLESLQRRLDEVERPRGVRAIWHKVFPGKTGSKDPS
jgi:hypothetical protein